MAAVIICSDFGAPQNKACHCFHCFPIYLPWSEGPGCHDLSCLNAEFLSQLFHSPTFIKRLFSSLVSLRVTLSAYLRLLIFLPAMLTLVCASFNLAFLMIYSAYTLNKQGDNIQLWHTPFPIWNQSVVPCPVLTVASRLHTDFSGGSSGGLVFPSLLRTFQFFVIHTKALV